MKKIIWISIIILIAIGIFFIVKNVSREDRSSIDQKEEKSEKELFEDYYKEASEELEKMTVEEKIGQMLLVRFEEENAIQTLEKYKFGGYVLFEKDFTDKSKEQVKSMISELQRVSKIPLLVAVDEEGGKVVRVSSNRNIREEKFKSVSELYEEGGFDKIAQDTIEKSELLESLGINLNLAPVVDVSTNSEDYIYPRTLGRDVELTGTYARTVINASKERNVSYTLKHFPGYSSNLDTHIGTSVDNRTYQEIVDGSLPPFKVGIEAGAEAVLISHNIVTSIDSENPATLSRRMNELLRNELGFTGIIITDDLDMKALNKYDNIVVKSVLAGNDLLIVTDYERSVNAIKTAIEDGTINEGIVDKAVKRIIAWKLYKGLI